MIKKLLPILPVMVLWMLVSQPRLLGFPNPAVPNPAGLSFLVLATTFRNPCGRLRGNVPVPAQHHLSWHPQHESHHNYGGQPDHPHAYPHPHIYTQRDGNGNFNADEDGDQGSAAAGKEGFSTGDWQEVRVRPDRVLLDLAFPLPMLGLPGAERNVQEFEPGHGETPDGCAHGNIAGFPCTETTDNYNVGLRCLMDRFMPGPCGVEIEIEPPAGSTPIRTWALLSNYGRKK